MLDIIDFEHCKSPWVSGKARYNCFRSTNLLHMATQISMCHAQYYVNMMYFLLCIPRVFFTSEGVYPHSVILEAPVYRCIMEATMLQPGKYLPQGQHNPPWYHNSCGTIRTPITGPLPLRRNGPILVSNGGSNPDLAAAIQCKLID